MEQKNRFPGFVGPSYESRAKRFDCQRLVNLYIELDESGGGKGGEPAVLISTPGLEYLQTLGVGPIRATYTLSNQQLTYIISGNEVYYISGGSAIPSLVTGNLQSSTGPISIKDNGVQLLFVDGTNGYYITLGDTTLNLINDPNFYPADTVTYQDGYFILNQNGTTNFFISDLYSIDFLPLNQAAKAGNSDILIAVISNNRELYLLGANTTEIWYNQGSSGSTPFVRQDGRFSQVGCVAPASVKVLQESFFWLGTNAQGGGIVYMLQNAMPTRISTHAIEYLIQSAGYLAGATAYSYQQEGHYFYCLNIPGLPTTLVYDLSTQQWSERQDEMGTARHFGQTHALLNNDHIIGDYRNGNIYRYNLDVHTDNGEAVLRLRQTPHASDSLNNIFYRLFELDCQFGVGLVDNGTNTGNAVTPRMMLQISKDGGQTFQNPIYGQVGQIGRWLTRCRWQRLGYGRDFVFRVYCSDPVKIQMLSAYVDAEAGGS
jgi:hypothetical protein